MDIKNIFGVAVAGVVMAISAGCSDLDFNRGYIDPGKYFSVVGVQQDGKIIPISGHDVVVARRPFALVLAFTESDSVLVNASYSARSFAQAARGPAAGPIDCFNGTAMREEYGNLSRSVVVADDAYQTWVVLSEKLHSFDALKVLDGAIACKRSVAAVASPNGNVEPIAATRSPSIYFVIIKTVWNNKQQRVEKQREWFKVTFSDSLQSAPQAVR